MPGSRQFGGSMVPDSLMWLRDATLPLPVREYLGAERDYYDSRKKGFASQVSLLGSSARAKMASEIVTPVWHVSARTFRYRWAEEADYFRLVEVLSDNSERLILDESSLTDTGFIRVGDLSISPDGNLVAYTVDTAGAERYELRVRDIESTEDIEVIFEAVAYGIVWFADSRRFLYTRVDAADRPCEVLLHQIRNFAEADVLLFREDDQHFYLEMRGSGDGKHAVIQCASRVTSVSYLIELAAIVPEPISLRIRDNGRRYYVEPVGVGADIRFLVIESSQDGVDTLIEYSDRLLTVVDCEFDLGPDVARLRTVLWLDGVIVASGRSDACATMWFLTEYCEVPVKLQPTDANGIFDLDIFESGDSTTLCLKYESKHSAVEWFAFSPKSGSLKSIATTNMHSGEKSEYESVAIELEVRDGKSVPVTITKRRSTPLDGTAPCLLYGYGAWEIVIRPEYSSVLLALLDQGFVYAQAHIRGGGEVDRQWWVEGSGKSKFRTFADFCDVARALGTGIVDPKKIVARGLSAGGLLMGSVYGSDPELFAGVIAEAPFVDPVTTMSDAAAPLVIIEFDEWGNPAKEEDLMWMLEWSPYDNCPDPKVRPPLLVTSAINDSRVSIWEPARWVAKMRLQGASSEIIFKVDLGARGHWPPPGRFSRVDFEAELLGWALSVVERVDLGSGSQA
jgi:oligopeptidase B